MGTEPTEEEEIDMIKYFMIASALVAVAGWTILKSALIGGLIDFRTLAAFVIVWSTAVVTLGPFYRPDAFSEKEATPETGVNLRWPMSCGLQIVGISFLILFANLLLEFWMVALCTYLISLLVGLVGTAASRHLK
jgi:hypothetical protein